MSRLHLVVDEPARGRVTVEDLDGGRHDVSLLAYDGPSPRPGTWLVVHSGFALTDVDEDEVASTLAEWRGPERRHVAVPHVSAPPPEPHRADPEECR